MTQDKIILRATCGKDRFYIDHLAPRPERNAGTPFYLNLEGSWCQGFSTLALALSALGRQVEISNRIQAHAKGGDGE